MLLTLVSLAARLWALYRDTEWPTMVFPTLGFSQLGVAVALRARPRTWTNPFLIVAVVIAGLLQLAGVYVPALAGVLGTHPLPLPDLAVAVGSRRRVRRRASRPSVASPLSRAVR